MKEKSYRVKQTLARKPQELNLIPTNSSSTDLETSETVAATPNRRPQLNGSNILTLQRTVGNQAVMRMIAQHKANPTTLLPAASNTVQRNAFSTFFRRTFASGEKQKAENPVKLDSTQGKGKDFLEQAKSNQQVFDKEGSDEEAKKQKKIEIRNKQRQIKLEMAKGPNTDPNKIQQLSDDITQHTKDTAFEGELKSAEDGEKYSGGIGKVTDFSSTVAGKSKSLAKVVNKGDTSTIGITSGSGNNEKIVKVGNADKGSDVIGGVTDLASIAQNISGLVASIKSFRKSGPDNPERIIAGDKIVNGFFDFGTTLVNTAAHGESLAGDFGGVAMANSMADQVPILGLVTSLIGLVQTAREMITQCYRVHKERQLYKEAQAQKLLIHKAALGHLRNRDIQLVADSSVQIIVLGLKVAGNIATMTGIGATVGAPLTTAASALGAANKVAHMLADSYKAGLVMENRSQFKNALGPNGNLDEGAGAATVLIKEDVKHAAQTLVHLARKFIADPQVNSRDELAFKALKLYGITEAMLKDNSIADKDLRAVIVSKLKESEDPQTLGDKLLEVVKTIKSIPAKFKELGGKPNTVRLMGEIKNYLNYGGKGKADGSERGRGWRAKQFLGGESAPEMESGIKYIYSTMDVQGKEDLVKHLKVKFGDTSTEVKALQLLIK